MLVSVTLSQVMEDRVLRMRWLLDFGEKPYPCLLTSDATGGLLSQDLLCFLAPVCGCTAVEGWESAIVSDKD